MPINEKIIIEEKMVPLPPKTKDCKLYISHRKIYRLHELNNLLLCIENDCFINNTYLATLSNCPIPNPHYPMTNCQSQTSRKK